MLRLRNIKNFRNGRTMTHTNPWIEYIDCVSVTFEWQKKDKRMGTVTQMASRDATLCGGRQWAAIVRRIRGYPGANDSTPVSTVWRNGKMEEIRSQEMITALRSAVLSIGKDKLRILENQIVMRSIILGAAMSMYLGECPVYTIMMIGRWSSDAFLIYI